MAYQVLARKWRPQQFDDVVGQEHVTRTLKNAIAENRVAHAYLLVGPRGTGKTSTARIFAKALNCEKGPTPTPCDQCDACREIMGGTALDVIEIDAASNTGVDHVRDLRDNARYTPARGPFKIYVIDEVHMLSTGAFNALLKTLEEPPPHVKFILATTEPQKVPATIQSRCQRFDLRRIATPVIVAALEKIAAAEQVDVDGDALLALARGAEGGMRDAQSALDQLISFVGTTIREPDVLSVFGLVARRTLEELAGAILTGDLPRIIGAVAELDESGKDMQRLVIELLEYFRNLLVVLHTAGAAESLDITGAQLEVLQAQAGQTHSDRLLDIVQVLTDTEGRLRYALSRRTLVEVALIRCARAATVVTLDEVLEKLNALRASRPAAPSAPADPAPGAPAKKKSADPVTEPEAEDTAPAPVEVPPTVPVVEVPSAPPVTDERLTDEHQRLFEHWHDLIDQVSHVAPLARKYLIDAKPLKVEAGLVTIGFDPEFESSMENIDAPRNRKALQKVLGRFLQREVGVHFKVMDSSDHLPGDLPLPGPGGPGPAVEEVPPEALTAEMRAVRDPVVRKVLEEFNGKIVDIRE